MRNLRNVALVASDDDLKRSLELTCLKCAEVLCDAEDGDTLSVLVEMFENHIPACPYPPQEI